MRQRYQPLILATFVVVVFSFLLVNERCKSSVGQTAAINPTARFQVPPGFIVERVAGPPLVGHPMLACFDDEGKLFVAESAGMNLRKPDLLKAPPNFIRVLHDRDKNGRFRNGHVFADKMTFPMGVLPYRGKVYSASPPSLWRLADNDGDGVADQRRELVTNFGFNGNAASIHGPFLGRDGWVYWTDGRHGHEIKRADGSMMTGKAARIFRCRPDGSDVEVVCGGGMDDPVEIAFTDEGEPLVTVDILHNKPTRNDGIIFAIEGGAYPWHRVYEEFKRTGDLLPAVADLGWVAPSGLMIYRSDALGKEYEGNLFSAQFNRHRIQRHILKRQGASFEIKTEDFLTSSDPNFHPTDVMEDADGSLLVVDTGGWFRIGCPTSQTAKPEFKGGIYRVRRKDAKPVADPHGLKIAWKKSTNAQLISLMDDPRFLVRDRAIDELAQRGKRAIAALAKVRKHPSVRVRQNAVWSLARITEPEANAAVWQFLEDSDFRVRLAAARVAGLNREPQALPQLLIMVRKDHPAARRQAATALGRLKSKRAVPVLLQAMEESTDRFLEHALIYALIEIADRDQTVQGLTAKHSATRRAALIALDQMHGGNLTRAQVVPQLNSTDAALQQTALNIISSRDGWGKEIEGLLRQWLIQPKLDGDRRKSLALVLERTNHEKSIQALMVEALQQVSTSTDARLLLLESMGRAGQQRLPPGWQSALQRQLSQQNKDITRQTIATIRAGGWTEFDKVLHQLANNKNQPLDIRLAALAAASPRTKRISAEAFQFLIKHVKSDSPLQRLSAAEALGNVALTNAQLMALSDVLGAAGPLELPHLLAAFERGNDAEVGTKLVGALQQSKALASIAPDSLQRTLKKYPPNIHQQAQPLFKRFKVNPGEQQARLANLEKLTAHGDARIGRSVFFGSKAACFTCHVVKGVGGRVGPDLSKIGGMRGRRDLLEAVVFPNASFVRGYEPYLVTTTDGRAFTGLLGRETAAAIFLTQPDRSEIQVPRKAIDSLTTNRVSIMPQGLDTQLSPAEFRDLMAYLESLR